MAEFKKYKSFILYIVFGAATTLVNMAVYYISLKSLRINNFFSNIIAWVFAVTFAYLTNRKWVFESSIDGWKGFVREASYFYFCRLATGFLDLAMMCLLVDYIGLHPILMKGISNMVVIAVNYAASKWMIFKK